MTSIADGSVIVQTSFSVFLGCAFQLLPFDGLLHFDGNKAGSIPDDNFVAHMACEPVLHCVNMGIKPVDRTESWQLNWW